MTRLAPLFAALALAAAPAAAHACMRPIAGPGERMAEPYVTVAVATVLEVRPEARDRPNRDFTAVLEIDRVVEGHRQSGRLVLRHAERTECPVVRPLPVVGEAWAVYLPWTAGEGGPVYDAWPLTWAERLDRRFGGRPDASIDDLDPPR